MHFSGMRRSQRLVAARREVERDFNTEPNMKNQLTFLAASILCVCGVVGCEGNGEEVAEDRLED
jgi:hypothetical protein